MLVIVMDIKGNNNIPVKNKFKRNLSAHPVITTGREVNRWMKKQKNYYPLVSYSFYIRDEAISGG